jgi:hypothetical protein
VALEVLADNGEERREELVAAASMAAWRALG